MSSKTFLALFALLFAACADATSWVRFANASLQGNPQSDQLEIRLDGRVVVAGLGYKSATGYLEEASGAPLLSVWHQGAQLFQRQLDLRNDRTYLFFLIGNGTELTPFEVVAEYETDSVLDETETGWQELLAAPYAGHPRLDSEPRKLMNFQRHCRCASGHCYWGGGSGELYPTWGLGLQFGAEKALHPQPYEYASGADGQPKFEINPDNLAPGTCSIQLVQQFNSLLGDPLPGGPGAPFPPGMTELRKVFVPAPASHMSFILVGDNVSAPVEWWILSQRARIVDPVPIRADTWAAGMWVAPEHPGLALSLETAVTQDAEGRRIETINGLLTGFDAQGRPRWQRMRESLRTSTALVLQTIHYAGDAHGGLNTRTGWIKSELRFVSCTRARLRIKNLLSMPRDTPFEALVDAQLPITLERITPPAENCSR